MNGWKPYATAFRLRARLETQYRGAAVGGFVTQLFFGLILVCLYRALYASGGEQSVPLWETVTYVWLQQAFFRALLSTDTDLIQSIQSGAVAYTLLRPVSQYGYWYLRTLAQKMVGCLMRAVPMTLLLMLLPRELSLAPPASLAAGAQFCLSLALGFLFIGSMDMITYAVAMRTLDHRGISSVIKFIMMFLSGNILPLTLFPDGWQAAVRYQPFAQALDAPIRLYIKGAAWSEALFAMGAQCLWLTAALGLGLFMWHRNLKKLAVQGG